MAIDEGLSLNPSESPSISGVYDFLVGGLHNGQRDREAAGAMLLEYPHVQTAVLRNRRFVQTAVRGACKAGVAQFLDIGCGIPSSPNTHEVAQSALDGDPTVVYVDNDPRVGTLADSMMRMGEGRKFFALRDVTYPQGILDDAGRYLNFDRPVAVILAAVLHFIQDQQQAVSIVRDLMAPLAPGSLVLVSHVTGELDPAVADSVAAYRRAGLPARMRTAEELRQILVGLEVLPPGLVSAAEWLGEPESERARAAMYCVVARKP